jgi:hypothetical protein
MRLILSQENGQYGRKILQMNHRSYNEMRGSTAVQYCHYVLPGQYRAIPRQYTQYCRIGHTAGQYFPAQAGFCSGLCFRSIYNRLVAAAPVPDGYK